MKTEQYVEKMKKEISEIEKVNIEIEREKERFERFKIVEKINQLREEEEDYN